MKNTNLKIIAGDWNGKTATIYRSFWAKRLDCLKIGNGWFRFRETVQPKEIRSVEALKADDKSKIVSMAKGGIIGGLIAGPLGLGAGALIAGSRRSKSLIRVTLVDGRSLVLEGTSRDFTTLYNAALENEYRHYSVGYDRDCGDEDSIDVDSNGHVREWRPTDKCHLRFGA